MSTPVYIRSSACISPQDSFGQPFPQPPVESVGVRLHCREPDYRALLDPKMIRRMSRVIRMGAAAALSCLRAAEIAGPDAIVTGTAYGCLEDTGLFLQSIIERREETLQPATFIQSTHNTVGAQIALLLQCTGYNNTFVHRGSSFENAMLDTMLLLADQEAATVLAGGVDEITDTSHALLTRFGLYRREPVSNLRLYSPRKKGTIAGEGAAFFLLAGQPSGRDLARLDAIETFCHPKDTAEVERRILAFLAAQDLRTGDIDTVVTGDDGDINGDAIYLRVTDALFPNTPKETFKQLCGEYPTAASFGLWFAANKVRAGAGKLLLYNHYQHHHSVYLLSPAHVTE